MNASVARIRAVLSKEWQELAGNRMVSANFCLLPVFMAALSIVMLVMVAHAPAKGGGHGIPPALAARFSDPLEVALFMMAQVAMLLFTLGPTVLPSIMASQSIVAEKLNHSLEPLLATPLRTWELIVAKLVATWVPSVIPNFVGIAIYVAVAARTVPPRVMACIWAPEWVLTVVLVGPLLAVLSTCLALLVSTRAADPQTAQALSGLIVLPVIGLGVGQILGGGLVSVPALMGLVAVLVALDVAAAALCVTMFEREIILTRWK